MRNTENEFETEDVEVYLKQPLAVIRVPAGEQRQVRHELDPPSSTDEVHPVKRCRPSRQVAKLLRTPCKTPLAMPVFNQPQLRQKH